MTSTAQPKRIAVLGANSRLGRAIIAISPKDIVGISRQASDAVGDNAVVVESYSAVTKEHFREASVIINCTGLVAGSFQHLQQANHSLPVSIAARARAAGVRQFIQISSLAVYANGQTIRATSLEKPQSHYGASKLMGDRDLLKLSTSDFHVSCLRLPTLYGSGDSKLSQLLNFWSRLKIFPVPKDDIARSMMNYDLAAECLNKMCDEPNGGVCFAADPEPFSYFRTRELFSDMEDGMPFRIMPLPKVVFQIGQTIIPPLFNRLYSDMTVSKQDNKAVLFGLQSRLYEDIATYVKNHNVGR